MRGTAHWNGCCCLICFHIPARSCIGQYMQELMESDAASGPGVGTQGRPLRVRANHFLVECSLKQAFHYDVNIQPVRDAPEGQPAKQRTVEGQPERQRPVDKPLPPEIQWYAAGRHPSGCNFMPDQQSCMLSWPTEPRYWGYDLRWLASGLTAAFQMCSAVMGELSIQQQWGPGWAYDGNKNLYTASRFLPQGETIFEVGFMPCACFWVPLLNRMGWPAHSVLHSLQVAARDPESHRQRAFTVKTKWAADINVNELLDFIR